MSIERPLPFTTQMVQALQEKLIDGRQYKIETRRLRGLETVNGDPDAWRCSGAGLDSDGRTLYEFTRKDTSWTVRLRCPFGEPGDRFWIRETWCKTTIASSTCAREKGRSRYWYRANTDENLYRWKWKPGMFMPKLVSRFRLTLTFVRPERLWECDVKGARREGIFPSDSLHRFEILWNSLNGKRGLGWGRNPWVWVLGIPDLEVVRQTQMGHTSAIKGESNGKRRDKAKA